LPVTAAEYELLCRLVQDDRTAFDAIYRQYFHPVYCNAIKITRDKEAAEDILQEVFITLWEKRKTISLEQSVGGWLFVLCYNKSVNLLRMKLRESSAYQLLQEPGADDIVDEMKYNLQWQILENAMAQLSPQKRKVFELCKIQGKTYEETASALQISKYTVKEYLSSAVSFVKEYVHHHLQSSVAVNTGIFIFLFANS
jgi:RNA polymerase sigma-70 factor (family 1)